MDPTDSYISKIDGGMEHPENVNARIEPEIRKVSIEKSGSGIPRKSTQLLSTRSYGQYWSFAMSIKREIWNKTRDKEGIFGKEWV